MDLLENNKKKNEKTKAQKIILILLVISIILCLIVGIAKVILSMQEGTQPYTISIDGENINLTELQLRSSENGVEYVSLKAICNKLGYSYYNGEFRVTEEDKSRGYIFNGTDIIQFFADSKKIYKTSEDSNKDYQYYNIDNNILISEDNLYIAVNDLDVALNLILTYSEKDNKTVIITPSNWISQNSEGFEAQGVTISDTPENIKALSYGYVVIGKDNRYGVINLAGKELIGNKYLSVEFVEYTGEFIISNTNNQFGVVTSDGEAKINLQYDSLEILNYNPLLYKVKKLQKYGILKEDGTIINDITFDSIGYPRNKEKEIDYTLIIPNINENIPESIVVCSGGKYGLLNIEKGEMVLDCTLNGIYSATKDGVVYYIVETQEKKTFLEDYINDINRVTVKLN